MDMLQLTLLLTDLKKEIRKSEYGRTDVYSGNCRAIFDIRTCYMNINVLEINQHRQSMPVYTYTHNLEQGDHVDESESTFHHREVHSIVEPVIEEIVKEYNDFLLSVVRPVVEKAISNLKMTKTYRGTSRHVKVTLQLNSSCVRLSLKLKYWGEAGLLHFKFPYKVTQPPEANPSLEPQIHSVLTPLLEKMSRGEYAEADGKRAAKRY